MRYDLWMTNWNFYSRVKEVWDTKKDAIRQSGEEIVQQLAEATAASASSPKLAQGLPQLAVESCALEVS
jgi:uncharacterized protein YyaL (SSP411 family)